MSVDTYFVEGGIGKCIAFTALVPALNEKAKEPIQVFTPYFDCFAANPGVKMVYDQNSIPIDHPGIQQSDNIEFAEPYKSNYIKGDKHLIEAYAELHNVAFDPNMVPQLYTDHHKESATKFLSESEIKGSFVMVQFTGGQSPLSGAQGAYQSINPGRNYPHYLGQQVVDRLSALGLNVLDCSLPNEPGYANSVKFQGHWPIMHELMKMSEGFIGIDSMLNHLSASAKKSGVVIWGNTTANQLGYTHNQNLTFHSKAYDPKDPRNIMVDPVQIVQVFVDKILGKPVGEIKTMGYSK